MLKILIEIYQIITNKLKFLNNKVNNWKPRQYAYLKVSNNPRELWNKLFK